MVPIIKTCVTMVTSQIGTKRGNFKKKYISKNMNSQRKTSTPGVFSSTIYHMTSEETAAIKVPKIRPKNPTIAWPEVMFIPMAIIIIAHTRRCSTKKRCVSFKKATIPTVKVAQATRNPNPDSGDPKNLGIVRSALPKCCQAVCGGRCSGSLRLLKPAPI